MTAGLRWPVIGIFLIMTVQALLWYSDFLIPITAALLGYLVVAPLRRRLARLGIPSVVTAASTTLGIFVVVAVGVVMFAPQLSMLITDLPVLIGQFTDALSSGGETLQKINDAVDAAEEVLDADTNSDTLEVKVVEEVNYIEALIKSAPHVIGQAVFALILMFFLISSGDLFMLKIVESVTEFDDKRKAVKIVQTLERKLGHYLGTITVINMGLGLAIALAMMAWGLSAPILFGIVAFALNFIPFLGAVFGASFAGLVAFSEFHDLLPALGVFLTYMALTSFEGQFVTPKLLSNQLKLNTPFVFIAVAFFAWIWSVTGMIVAVPILIVVKVIMDEFEATKKVGAFLGGL